MAGVADELRHSGIAVFGPGARRRPRSRGRKSFAKDVMGGCGRTRRPQRWRSPRPPLRRQGRRPRRWQGCRRLPHAGRARRRASRRSRGFGGSARDRGAARRHRGARCSHCATVVDAVALVPAQDYKRAYDHDLGPQHRWHGRICTRTRLSTTRSSGLDRRKSSPAWYSPSLPAVGRPFVGLPLRRADAHERTEECWSSTAGSVIPRHRWCYRSSRATCSRRSPRRHGDVPGRRSLLPRLTGAAVTVVRDGGRLSRVTTIAASPIDGSRRRRKPRARSCSIRNRPARRTCRDERRSCARE